MTKEEAFLHIIDEAEFDGPPVGVFREPDGTFPSPWLAMHRRRGRTILQGNHEDLIAFLKLVSEPIKSIPQAPSSDVYTWHIGRWLLGWMLLKPQQTQIAITIFIENPRNWMPLLDLCEEIEYSQVFDWVAMILHAATESGKLTEELYNRASSVMRENMQEVTRSDYQPEIEAYLYLLIDPDKKRVM